MVRLLGLLQSTLGLAPLVFNIVPYVFSVFWEGEMREREREAFFLPFLLTEEERQCGTQSGQSKMPPGFLQSTTFRQMQ